MKWWAVSILLIIMIALTVPFVTADDKKGDFGKTPANIEKKAIDGLAPLKKAIGMDANTDIEIIINGKRAAILPENSPLITVPITNECVREYPYGSLQWYQCEVK